MATKKTPTQKKKEEEDRQKIKTPKDVLALMGKLNKEKGNKAIALEEKKACDFCSTGVLSLDLILGGGYYGGQVIQYFGRSHCGKSTLQYSSAAWCTGVAGIPGALFDHEVGTDKKYTIRLGVDYDSLMYFRPETGEWTYEWIEDFCNKLPDKHSGLPQAVMFIDSVKTMKPQKYIDSPENQQPAIEASMHSKGWTKIATLIGNKHVSVVAVNQVRGNAGNAYGSNEVVPGGNAWEFSTTNLVRMSRDGSNVELPNGKVFQPCKFKTYKNRNFIPMQECKVYLELGVGWDIASDVAEFCTKAGYLTKRDRTPKGKPKGPPLLRGLSPTVDQQFKSKEEFEETVRAQGRNGPIYLACRAALESGDAIERFRVSNKGDDSEGEATGLLEVKKAKKSNLAEEAEEDDNQDTDLAEDEEDEEDDEDTEAAAEHAPKGRSLKSMAGQVQDADLSAVAD